MQNSCQFDPLREFTLYLQIEKGASSNTIEAYIRDIESFIKNRDIKFLSQDDFIRHFSEMKKKRYASSTIARSFVSIRSFYRFLIREKFIEDNFTLLLETPKIWQTIPTVLSIAEIERLLNAPSKEGFKGVRDHAILEVLYGSGLRVSEVISLSINSIDDVGCRVIGKGGKERIIPLGMQALAAVDAYLLQYRDTFKDKKNLFLTARGKPLNRMTIWKSIKEYSKKAGITKNVSPHTLRHSFATHLLDNGADIRVIQEMLGHSNIATTDGYTHVSRTKLQESFKKFHLRN